MTWLCVDGNGIMRRLYHANGEREGLAERFAEKVRRWSDQFSVDRNMYVAWDRKPTARQAMLPTYKAHRGETPAAVVEGIGKSQACTAWANLYREGWEADDVLASLCAEAHADTRVVIVSDDKDLLALTAWGDVVVARPCKHMATIGGKGFHEEWGFRPELMPDFLALAGDSADGIPGVPGIGERNAKALLSSWGSLENIYEKRVSAEPSKKDRVGRLLRENEDEARLYKRVATLNDRLLEGGF